MELDEGRCDVVSGLCVGDNSCSKVLDDLKSVQKFTQNAREDSVAVFSV